ncbi:MAG TPA: hypothetical protein VGN26_19665 [Armatimonadota bacterium]|jgi:hypothetical protein
MRGLPHGDIPPFSVAGVLPPNSVAVTTLRQMRHSHLITGEGNNWESDAVRWRGELFSGLCEVCFQLRYAGLARIYVDGSFVTNVEYPNDIDAYTVIGLEAAVDPRLVRSLDEAFDVLHPDQPSPWPELFGRDYNGVTRPRGDGSSLLWDYHGVHLLTCVEGEPHRVRTSDGKGRSVPGLFYETRDGIPKGLVVVQL